MAILRKELGLAAAACAAILLLAGSALAGNPNAPGAGNGKSPAKGGTPPGQAKKGTNGHQGNGKAKAKHSARVNAKPSHPAHPVHPLTPMPQGSVHSQAPPTAPAKGRGHEKTAQHKVIICHRTGSSTNPYVVINISINAWQHGHTTHPALDGRSDILLQDPARPGEKLDASQCPGAGQQQGQQQGSAGTSGGDQAGHVANAKPRTGGGGVLGATATKRSNARPRSGSAGAGVLGAFSSRVTRGQLPFTGLPLWPAALIAAALMAAGFLVRRRGQEPV